MLRGKGIRYRVVIQRWLIAAVLSLPIGALAAASSNAIWSNQATQPRGVVGQFSWTSADGKGSLALRDGKAVYRQDASTIDVATVSEAPWMMEIGQSPAGDAVFVNASDGGAVGTWNTSVIVRMGGKLVELPLRRIIDQARHQIIPEGLQRDWQNVGSVAWLDGGKRLLVAQAWPGSSSYGAAMGKGAFFVVDVARQRVEQVLSPREALAHEEWCRLWSLYAQGIFDAEGMARAASRQRCH